MKQLYCFLRLKAVIWTISLFCLFVASFVTFVCLNTEQSDMRHKQRSMHNETGLRNKGWPAMMVVFREPRRFRWRSK